MVPVLDCFAGSTCLKSSQNMSNVSSDFIQLALTWSALQCAWLQQNQSCMMFNLLQSATCDMRVKARRSCSVLLRDAPSHASTKSTKGKSIQKCVHIVLSYQLPWRRQDCSLNWRMGGYNHLKTVPMMLSMKGMATHPRSFHKGWCFRHPWTHGFRRKTVRESPYQGFLLWHPLSYNVFKIEQLWIASSGTRITGQFWHLKDIWKASHVFLVNAPNVSTNWRWKMQWNNALLPEFWYWRDQEPYLAQKFVASVHSAPQKTTGIPQLSSSTPFDMSCTEVRKLVTYHDVVQRMSPCREICNVFRKLFTIMS